jgi:vacuolar protein-sorting-associated protein 4
MFTGVLEKIAKAKETRDAAKMRDALAELDAAAPGVDDKKQREIARIGAHARALLDQWTRPPPACSWDDVVGQSDAKQVLQEALVLPARQPGLFTGARRPWRSLLLFGPPGTGKTMLARAAAAQCGASFHAVAPADLFSKWLGESEGAVRALFARVRAARPAILFIDEVEALCRRRDDAQHETSARVLTEFLTALDGAQTDAADGVFVLGATNCPELLDPAMLRRFQRRIHVGLPDAAAREAILRRAMGDTPHAIGEGEWARLAAGLERFSGADIANLVREAAMRPVRELVAARFFPCNTRRLGGVLGGRRRRAGHVACGRPRGGRACARGGGGRPRGRARAHAPDGDGRDAAWVSRI